MADSVGWLTHSNSSLACLTVLQRLETKNISQLPAARVQGMWPKFLANRNIFPRTWMKNKQGEGVCIFWEHVVLPCGSSETNEVNSLASSVPAVKGSRGSLQPLLFVSFVLTD